MPHCRARGVGARDAYASKNGIIFRCDKIIKQLCGYPCSHLRGARPRDEDDQIWRRPPKPKQFPPDGHPWSRWLPRRFCTSWCRCQRRHGPMESDQLDVESGLSGHSVRFRMAGKIWSIRCLQRYDLPKKFPRCWNLTKLGSALHEGSLVRIHN